MGEQGLHRSLCFENHKKVLTQSIDNFLTRQAFVDMTLVCNAGKKIKVHRAVLAACSPLFENILIDIDDQSHPVLIFSDISEIVMVCIIEFIYQGRTSVSPAYAEAFLNVAKKLQIRGLEKYDIHSKDDLFQLPVNSVKGSMSHKKQRSTTKNNSPGNVTLEPDAEVSEDIPLTIKTGSGIKVINPFALKQLQKDDDSVSTEDDLCVPGPSESRNGKEVVSSQTGNIPEDDDSDIEFIEDNINPSVVVIGDTQPETTNPEKWLTTVQTNIKRPLVVRKSTSDIESDSDDSEIRVSRKKKKSMKNVQIDNEETVKVEGVEKINSKDQPHFSDTSESPELITPIEMRDLPKAMVPMEKEENPNVLSDTEFLQKSFQSLGRFCVNCKVFKKNIGVHVKRLHAAPIRRPVHVCKVCSKRFYMEYTLKTHKCTS